MSNPRGKTDAGRTQTRFLHVHLGTRVLLRARVLLSAAAAMIPILLLSCSCPWTPPPTGDIVSAALTWEGDADLDLELYRVTSDRPETAPLELLLLERIDGVIKESVDGRRGERIVFAPSLESGRFLLAARFWSVGPTNTRRVTASMTVEGWNDENGGDPIAFTADLDDDSADHWFPCIVDLDRRRVLPRGDTRVAGL